MKKPLSLWKLIGVFALCAALLLGAVGCGAKKQTAVGLDPKSPVTVTVWNYYNGDQLAAFDALVEEFNSTVGLEKGVVVACVSQGDITTLADSLISSVKGEAGSQEKPVLAAVYAETAFILNEAGALEGLDSYFTPEELAVYVPGFIEEGRFNEGNDLLLFPILKSTEVFSANVTDWAPFAQATGVTLESIANKEDLTAAAEQYYLWTDAQTPEVPEDGKALYGRDSIANYIYIGSYQLGHGLFSIQDGKMTMDLDRATFRTLWDNYYIPFINGYFGAYGKFRSEDCKTGKILALTSSSSSVSYLPTAVTLEDDTTHDIDTSIGKTLPFKNAVTNAVVQQGASYCMLKATPAQQLGAVEFLKWFSQPQRNTQFAMMSGYSPVVLEANDPQVIKNAYSGDAESPKGRNVLNSLMLCADVFTNDEAYATKPFSGSKEVRSILDNALDAIAMGDREAVLAAIASGATRAEAVAPYVTDAYFNAWFDALVKQVEQTVGK